VNKGLLANPRKCKRHCLPSPQQELLLKASLLEGNEAIEAWEEWKSTVDVNLVDSASHRMLPLLYRNLQTLGITDPSMAKYKGVYRQTWYKNQILFHAIASLLRSFEDANIQTMVLKGAALTVLYYKDYGLRPMNDFDVLIRAEKVLPAIGLLETLGWSPMDFMPTEKYISVSYSHGFRNSAGQEFDLHWHLLSQSRGINADDDFWDGAVPCNINNVATRALNPTDQLLHICIHGAKWNFIPPFRWVADAMTILNTSQFRIDWKQLMEQCERRRLVLPLSDALNYLKEIFDAPIAPGILKKLREIPVPNIERIEYKIAVNPPTQWTAMSDLWCQHYRLTGNVGLLQKITGFPRFLQNIWGIPAWKLPLHGLSKMITWHENRLSKRPSE
jgi:hypothetical protein